MVVLCWAEADPPHQLQVCRGQLSLPKVGILTSLLPTAAKHMSQPWGSVGLDGERHRELDWLGDEGTCGLNTHPISAHFHSWLDKIEDFLGAYLRNLPWQSGAKATQPDPLLGHGFCCPKAQFHNVSGEGLVAAA